ncbi:MAG: hypothetical protein NT067_01095 [Candidatus Diapherotrites archaeon]|nr:hypothetical protein [Candidatus Diapherotrites archaeon]
MVKKMQAIEIIVFFFFAVLAGFVVIGFISGFDFRGMQGWLSALLEGKSPETGGNYEKVSYSVFISRVSDCWSACGFGKGERDCGLFYVNVDNEKDYGKTLSAATLTADFKKFNICDECKLSIPTDLRLPATVKLECSGGNITITG